jgi:hypothetical protein
VIWFVNRSEYKKPFRRLQDSSRGGWYSASRIGYALEKKIVSTNLGLASFLKVAFGAFER